MGNPQGQLPPVQSRQGHAAVMLSCQDEVDLRPGIFGSVHNVGIQGGPELVEPVHRVVEVGDGLVEGGGGVVPQHPLELAEGPGGGLKELRRRGLQTVGALHEGHQPPHGPVGVGEVGPPIGGGQHGEGLPVRIAPLLLDFLPEEGGDPQHILHQLFGMGEGGQAQPLQNKTEELRFPGLHAVGVVDMAHAVSLRLQDLSGEAVGSQGFFQVSFHHRFLLICNLFGRRFLPHLSKTIIMPRAGNGKAYFHFLLAFSKAMAGKAGNGGAKPVPSPAHSGWLMCL